MPMGRVANTIIRLMQLFEARLVAIGKYFA